MSVEFFGLRGMGQIGGLNKMERPGESRNSAKAEAKAGVSFSSALHGAQAAKAAGAAEDPERAARIQALKEQIASGQYAPDLHKVSSSLLKFLVEG